MKQLMRRLSRVSDSSQYFLLRSDSSSPRPPTRTRHRSDKKRGRSVGVPEGHLPVYVGEEMERFVVSAEFLNHPIFMELLNQSANEYGYEQQGVLRIPCGVLVFERVLEMLKDGGDVQELFSLQFL